MARAPNGHVPDSIAVECDGCGRTVAAVVEGHYSFFAEGPDLPIRFLFARCPNCNLPMIAQQENEGDWDDDRHFTQPVRILPAPLGAGAAVPTPVASAYEEALRCFSLRACAAASIMCRKALEALRIEHKVEARNLDAALKAMRDQGHIEQRLYEWADALRLTGNAAAHDVSASISRDDARDMLDFTSALMEYVFTYRDRVEAFKRRQAAKGATT